MGMSHGESDSLVVTATNRTIRAFDKIARLFFKWPKEEERYFLSSCACQKFGFNGAIGSTDGTPIPLFEAPSITPPWAFFDRKSRYSVHALVTVDHNYRIIDVVVHYLGPAPDCIVQREAMWQRYPEHFFRRPICAWG